MVNVELHIYNCMYVHALICTYVHSVYTNVHVHTKVWLIIHELRTPCVVACVYICETFQNSCVSVTPVSVFPLSLCTCGYVYTHMHILGNVFFCVFGTFRVLVFFPQFFFCRMYW